MGQTVANAGLRGHGTGDPITSTTDLWLHWGDKNLNHQTAVNDTQAVSLQAAAQVSQAAFDTVAGNIAPWYALTGLSSSEKTAARARVRAGVLKFTNTPRPSSSGG